KQSLVYLLQPQSLDRFTFATNTVGGSIAIKDLVDRTKWMRRFRGENVHPVVTLSDRFMATRFGGRQRPHFNIVRWITFGDGGPALAQPNAAPALTGL